MPKVLLVEDDNNLREIFQMRLQAEGYATVTAADGEEGLVVAMKEKPDLVIADVMMPKLSGFEMIENLRATPEMENTKVIMMTALGQAEDQARGEKLGVVKYLVKSQVTLEDFARVVKDTLGPGSPSDVAATTQAKSSTTNQQESETQMQEDPASNPTPNPAGMPADNTAPAANPMGDSTPAADAGVSSDQPTSAQESGAVQSQINDFVGSSSDAASSAPLAGDAPAPATPPAEPTSTDSTPVPPASEPPATPTEPPAGTDQPSTPPTDPTSNAL